MKTEAKFVITTLLLGSIVSAFSAIPERDRLRDRSLEQARSTQHDRSTDRDRDRVYGRDTEKKVDEYEERMQNKKMAEQNQQQTQTPPKLSQTDQDLELRRQLRERILAEDQLSTRARNIKIITDKDAILLEGAVSNKAEKVRLENLARSMAGKKKVYNRLTY